ncbi:NAD(P)-dependent oxidoreductase [Curtobacterium sp. L1-20]|uniref:NAD(P)-dependent oxidoreductase n=1 Tax=Curtobacterium sp. L1-20 TaxID=3138181 RepID=UPI003B51FF27
MMAAKAPADHAPNRVGIGGIGHMGSALLRRLAGAGWSVSVHDRDIRHAADAEAVGCGWQPDLAALVSEADVVLTVLPDAAATESAMTDRVLAAARPGTVWVDLTSGDPDTTRRSRSRADRYDIALVAAPMGGSPDDAEHGTLRLFVAGPTNAVERVRAVLTTIAGDGGVRTVSEDPADAQTVKLLVNALWCASALATSEALLVAQHAGIASEHMQELLRGTAAASTFSDKHLPRFLAGDDLDTFGIDGLVTELRTVRAIAGETHTPVLDASLHQYDAALARFGPTLGELLGVRLLEIQNHRTLRTA